jgi:preprotein translocase subunit SecD
MNRYPLWKYAVILVALLIGAIYALPNFYGEAPAVQVSGGKASVKVDASTLAQVEQALSAAGLKAEPADAEGLLSLLAARGAVGAQVRATGLDRDLAGGRGHALRRGWDGQQCRP